jgi:hypothetical protein
VIYRIRPRDEKHPVLMPVGERAPFRIQKDKMLKQVEDVDEKEREYSVVSMTPRQDRNSSETVSPK